MVIRRDSDGKKFQTFEKLEPKEEQDGKGKEKKEKGGGKDQK